MIQKKDPSRVHFLKHPVLSRVLNGISFYVQWFTVLSFASAGNPWPGVAIAVTLLGFHYFTSSNWHRDLILIGVLCVLGLLADSTYMWLGLLRFESPNPVVPWLAPAWVLCLYAFFATTLNSSLSYAGSHRVWLAILGGFGGPFSYWLGVKIGAAEFLVPETEALLVIAGVWVVSMPFVAELNRRLRVV